MTRGKLIKFFGGLALLAPLSIPAWADDEPGHVPVRIYTTEEIIQQATSQVQAPEQAVPKSTENTAAPTNGAAKEAESVNFLMEQLDCTSVGPRLNCNGIKVSGWLDQGFTWNPDNPHNRFNFPQTFNDRSNDYQMNQLYLIMEKAVNTEGCCWDFGGRIDVLYGSDYYFTESTGWETHPNGSQHWNGGGGPRFQFGSASLYGLAIPQLYAEAYIPWGNGIDLKLGHFYTPMGYETVTATGNFFYSHAYTHQYFEPFTHWGALAATNVSDSLKLQVGAVMGWDVLDDTSDKFSALAALTWTSCDKNTSLFYGIMFGEEPGLVKEDGRIYQSIYLTHKITEQLTSVTGTDLLWQNNGSTNNAGEVADAEAYSIYQYFLYDINKCLSAGLRFEASRDDDNLRVLPIGAAAPGANYFELTAGLNWKIFENLKVRPEVRWDWSNFPSDIHGVGVYDDFSDKNQFTAAFDVILTF